MPISRAALIWKVEWDDRARRELRRLDRSVQRTILRYISDRIRTPEDPRRFGRALHHSLGGLWRYRSSFRSWRKSLTPRQVLPTGRPAGISRAPRPGGAGRGQSLRVVHAGSVDRGGTATPRLLSTAGGDGRLDGQGRSLFAVGPGSGLPVETVRARAARVRFPEEEGRNPDGEGALAGDAASKEWPRVPKQQFPPTSRTW